jgi:hypothetical protein
VDFRPAPYPFYRVAFGQPAAEAPPEAPGPSVAIALSRWLPPMRPGWAEMHEDPENDRFALRIDGRLFVGHAGLPEPAPRLLFAWRDDGLGGAFLVKGLHEVGGEGRLDAEGTWRCPPIDETLPEVRVVARRVPRDAVRASAEPPRLPYSLRRVGREWWATAADGESLPVTPDLAPLRLAASLRRGAERGQIVLMVRAELREGEPPRLVARELQGVAPAPPEGGDGR